MVVVYTEILDFVVPSSLPAGADVNVRVRLRNADTISGYVAYGINDESKTVEAGSSYPMIVSPGGVVWLDVFFRYFKMPDHDWNLTATNYDGTSTISRTIFLSVGEGKALITNINLPTELQAGEWIVGTLRVENIGVVKDNIRILITADWIPKSWAAQYELEVGQGLTASFVSGMVAMPEIDAHFTLKGQHTENGIWVTDDTKTH